MRSLFFALAMLCGAVTALAQGQSLLLAPVGKVMINRGEGFVAAVDGLAFKAGDRVLIGEESFVTAQIGSCAVSLNANTIYTIPAKAPCMEGQTAWVEAGVMIEPAAYGSFGSIPWAPALAVIPVFVIVTYAILSADNKNGEVAVSAP